MFRRRRQGEQSEEDLATTAEQTDAAGNAEGVEGGAGAEDAEGAAGQDQAEAAADGGPWDVDDSFPELDRIDFGALRIPIGPGLEVQVNVEATETDAEGNPVNGRMVAITVMYEDSGLQLQAFAAPKRGGIWDEVRKETSSEIAEAGGQTHDVDGPFGTELMAMVPVEVPEEVHDQVSEEIREQGYAWQPVRFIGVDGPRWFLRAVVSGAALEDEEQWQVLEDVLRNIVVVRGDHPLPPRELLELQLPPETQQAASAQGDQGEEGGQAGAGAGNPFERGPEITEVR